MKKRFLIIRHAEAEKTLKGIHGGIGTPLTEQGRSDAEKLLHYLLREFSELKSEGVVCSSFVPQVLETAEYIHEKLGVTIWKFKELQSMHMGILSGLSDTEAKEKYPEEMKRLELWRAHKLDEKDLQIPEKEPLHDFLSRINLVLANCFKSNKKYIIIIVTRSVGIGILNLLLKNSELKGQRYKRYKFDPCSITFLECSIFGKAKLIFENQTFFLERKIDYPDD